MIVFFSTISKSKGKAEVRPRPVLKCSIRTNRQLITEWFLNKIKIKKIITIGCLDGHTSKTSCCLNYFNIVYISSMVWKFICEFSTFLKHIKWNKLFKTLFLINLNIFLSWIKNCWVILTSILLYSLGRCDCDS